ncbi:hypothetical protein [Aureliella helgolandensis]|uniref:hypothetical protein n=1 Tax=Aureliella helgolandensis TaxID=2527968 RepID=UPI0011A0F6D7|nr:hypothetical protein [Aureliella helgolandensis]
MRQPTYLFLAIAGLLLAGGPSPCFAQSPHAFPWGHAHQQAVPLPLPRMAPYAVLATPLSDEPLQRPYRPLPATPPYAYGWFGSNPSPQWSRHFGVSHSHTQWTLK